MTEEKLFNPRKRNPKKREIKTAVGYTRVSTEEQVDGASKEVQKQAILDYGKQHGIEITEIFWDGGYSAKTAKRPELQRMLREIGDGTLKTDAVIVYNLSRISRNTDSFSSEIVPVLSKKGVLLRSTKENIDDSPEGKLLKTISLAVYQYDNDNKACTTGDNMHQVAIEGYWQSQAPLGMKAKHVPSGKRDKDGKMRYRTVLEPDETNDTARKVTDLLHYAAEGHRPAAAVRFAEKIGLRTRRGNKFTPQSMENLLDNAALAGYICSSSLTDGEYYKANWDGLISLEEHLTIQRVLYGGKNPDEKQSYCRDNPDFPLKGTLICEKCGYAARGSCPKNGSGKPSPRYHCSECTGAGSLMPDVMHEKFTDLLSSLTPVKSLLKAFSVSLTRAMHHSVEKAEAEISEKKTRLEEIQSENDESFALVMRHKRSEADHKRFVGILEKEKTELEESLAETEDYKSLSEAKIKRLISLMEDPAEMWKKAPLEVRRMLQQMIFPFGIKANLGTGEFEKVGTHNLSPLYSVIPPKNGSNEPSNSPLVPEMGLEPIWKIPFDFKSNIVYLLIGMDN